VWASTSPLIFPVNPSTWNPTVWVTYGLSVYRINGPCYEPTYTVASSRRENGQCGIDTVAKLSHSPHVLDMQLCTSVVRNTQIPAPNGVAVRAVQSEHFSAFGHSNQQFLESELISMQVCRVERCRDQCRLVGSG
jgi:hypothetical protein